MNVEISQSDSDGTLQLTCKEFPGLHMEVDASNALVQKLLSASNGENIDVAQLLSSVNFENIQVEVECDQKGNQNTPPIHNAHEQAEQCSDTITQGINNCNNLQQTLKYLTENNFALKSTDDTTSQKLSEVSAKKDSLRELVQHVKHIRHELTYLSSVLHH